MGVVVGHAMRTVQAAVGMIAVADYRIHQWKTTKKKLLTKKVTYHIDGYTKPIWKMATPREFQPRATPGSVICATGIGPDVCPTYAIAPAMVNIDTWTGGNLDEREDMLYQWQKSVSGFTVLAFILLIFVMAFVLAVVAVAAGFAASSTSIIATMIEHAALAAGLELSLGPLAVAGIQAAAYGVMAAMQGGGLTDIQDGLFGKIVDTGTLIAAKPQNEHQASLVDRTNVRMTQVAIDNSLIGVKRTGYGDCSAKTSAAGCSGAKGLLPRSDSWVGHDYVQFYMDNGAPVRYDGGVDLQQ